VPAIPNSTAGQGCKSQSSDTNVDSDVLRFSLLRQLTLEGKVQQVVRLDRAIRQLSPLKNMVEDPISLAKVVSTMLDDLTIPYYIGGSLASSLLGEPRYSEDLDLIISITPGTIQSLIQALQDRFYISESTVDDALNVNSLSFNFIGLVSSEKIDFFVSQSDDFSVSKMTRRCKYALPEDDFLWICSAEDIVLQKLIWFSMNANEAQKQWRDILGVLKLPGNKLDFDYLKQRSKTLGLTKDLNKAQIEAGL
jgi:hypothetical protein